MRAVNANLLKPTFSVYSVLIGKTASPVSALDLDLDYDEVFVGDVTKISITEV